MQAWIPSSSSPSSWSSTAAEICFSRRCCARASASAALLKGNGSRFGLRGCSKRLWSDPSACVNRLIPVGVLAKPNGLMSSISSSPRMNSTPTIQPDVFLFMRDISRLARGVSSSSLSHSRPVKTEDLPDSFCPTKASKYGLTLHSVSASRLYPSNMILRQRMRFIRRPPGTRRARNAIRRRGNTSHCVTDIRCTVTGQSGALVILPESGCCPRLIDEPHHITWEVSATPAHRCHERAFACSRQPTDQVART